MFWAPLYKKVKERKEGKASTTQGETTVAIPSPLEIQDSTVEIAVDSTPPSAHVEANTEPTLEVAAEPESIAVHPIQTCDDDILSTIFEWFTCDYTTFRNHRAARLTKVCRRWRQIALQTPALWRHFDINLNRSTFSLRKQWDWLLSMRPAGPDDIRIDCIKPGYLDQSALVDLWSQCRFTSLERITLLEFAFLNSTTGAEVAIPNIALPNTRIDRLWIDSCECTSSYGTLPPWEVDQLLETFPYVQYLRLSRQSNFSFRPVNLFLNTTYLSIRNCVDVSIFPGLRGFVNLERLQIKYTTMPEGSVPPTTTIQLPALKWLCIYQVPWFPWTKLDCPSLEVLTGEESVTDAMIDFLERHPHLRDIDVQVDKQLFASFARTIPHVETLDLGGYIEGLVEWQTTTDLVDPPFPNLKRLILDRTETEIGLDLFESIIKTYCLPSQSHSQPQLHLTGESNPRKRTVECLGVFGTLESFETAEWAQSTLLADCVRSSCRYPHLDSWICLEFRWPESSNH
ncbi:hypothetical protein FRC14_008303 [Serendipita sp. 396]|nr:hypothetical protein FRC14_008303 [Serendipita sp. 396]KAG8855463.1 hypothetical protein FRC20_000763 [Serendipita sp. 405]